MLVSHWGAVFQVTTDFMALINVTSLRAHARATLQAVKDKLILKHPHEQSPCQLQRPR